MDKVYVVLAGEAYEGSEIVSIHSHVEAARIAAARYMELGMGLGRSLAYKADPSGLSWKAKSGHYVEVVQHKVD